jgi:hypothetical protein
LPVLRLIVAAFLALAIHPARAQVCSGSPYNADSTLNSTYFNTLLTRWSASSCSGQIIFWSDSISLTLSNWYTFTGALTLDASNTNVKPVIKSTTTLGGRMFVMRGTGGVMVAKSIVFEGPNSYTASCGPSISLYYPGSYFSSCEFRYNRCKSGSAIYFDAGTDNYGSATFLSCDFYSNSAIANGAALCLYSLTSAVIFSSNFYSNSAVNGGSIYVHYDPSVTIIQSSLYSNSASTAGGAIWNCGTLTLNTISFSSNTAPLGPDLYTCSNGTSSCSAVPTISTAGPPCYLPGTAPTKTPTVRPTRVSPPSALYLPSSALTDGRTRRATCSVRSQPGFPRPSHP